MKRIELLIENIILASRWLLVVFYLGLAVALAIYAVSFVGKLFDFATKVTALNDTDTILKVLGLIDAALIASLVVMVIISGYENFVSRFDQAGDEVHWLGTIDAGSLQIFLNATTYTSNQLLWFTIIHLAFVFSALFLAYIDKLTAKDKGGARGKGKIEPNI